MSDVSFAETEASCPLCGSRDNRRIGEIETRAIVYFYRRRFGVDVSRLVTGLGSVVAMVRCHRCGLEFHRPSVEGDGSFYHDLAESPGYYDPVRWEFSLVQEEVAGADSILDVGCGTGAFLAATDIDDRWGHEINPASRKALDAQGIRVAPRDLSELPESGFEVVTLFQVLEHVMNPAPLIDTAVRLLRPGGRLYISVPNNDGFVGTLVNEPLNAPPHHPLRWRASALHHLGRQWNLTERWMRTEPLSEKDTFAYLRQRIFDRITGFLGARERRLHLDPRAVIAAKSSSMLTSLLLRFRTPAIPEGVAGHSLLVSFRVTPGSGRHR